MIPSPSPSPPPPPDTSPPHSPSSDRHSPPLPSPPPLSNVLDHNTTVSPLTSSDEVSEEESDESYFYDDSDAKDENIEIRRPKVSTTRCYEVNASPYISGNEEEEAPKHRKASQDKGSVSSRRGLYAKDGGRSSQKGTAARVKKKKKRDGPRVSKYKENTKTVRQQIKPGTVEDLATLFTGWNAENEEKVTGYGGPNDDCVYMSNGNVDCNSEQTQQDERRKYVQREDFDDKLDFIAASKVIQEKLILSRQSSMHRPSARQHNVTENSNTEENTENNLEQQSTATLPTRSNNGPDSDEGFTKTNTNSAKSCEEETRDKTELERPNMTARVQTNKNGDLQEGKQMQERAENEGVFKLIMSKGNNSDGVSRESRNRLDRRTSKSDKDINKETVRSESTYKPISVDNITLCEITEASNSHAYTHSPTTNNYNDDSNLSHQAHAINNGSFKTGLDETGCEKNSHHDELHTDQAILDIKSGGVPSMSSDTFKITTSENEINNNNNNIRKRKDSDGVNSNAWESSSTTSSVPIKDGGSDSVNQNVFLKCEDDSWVTVDISPHVIGNDTDDGKTITARNGNNMADIPDVSGVLRPEGNKNKVSTSQTSTSTSYIISRAEENNEETVTPPLKNSFLTDESLNRPEHSANVNMQLLKNLQSQTREGSRLDVFAHSSRVWSGMRSNDDDDGGGGGGGGDVRGREGGMEEKERHGAMTDDIQTNKRPILSHSQTQTEGNDHKTLESNGDTSTATCVNSVTENSGDEFLSILDGIQIKNDPSSNFLKNRNKLNSTDNIISSGVSENNNENKVTTNEFMNRNNKINNSLETGKQDVTLVQRTESHQFNSSAHSAAVSDNNESSLSSHSKPNIEEEIQELHRQLSPQSSLKDTGVKDKSSNNDAEENRSSRSSSISSQISSSANSQIENDTKVIRASKKIKNTRETSFNVDFFSSSTSENRKEETDVSGNDASANEDKLEVDQILTSRAELVSKSNDDTAVNPGEESQTGAIITSRESFRSVRDQFESDKDDKNSSPRTPSFKNSGSSNVIRRSSGSSRKWRKSGSGPSSWVVEDSVVDVLNENQTSGDKNSKHIVSESEGEASSSSSPPTQKDSLDFEQESKESTMTAVVGKVSSFNIHRRGGAHQDSPHISSSQTGSNDSDVYLIQDNSGDVYALQEINTQQPRVQSYEGDNYTSFETSSSSQHTSYQQPVHHERPAELYVDDSAVNDSKAREVISAYLSTDPNFDQSNNVVTQSHSQTYSTQDESFSTSTITRNPNSIVVHQENDIGGGFTNNNINFSGHGFNNNLLNNSTVAVDTQVDGRFDASQTWNSGNSDPYTVGGGAESGYRSSLVVTNLNTPNQKMYTSYSNTPSGDNSLDSQYNTGFNVIRGSQSIQPFQPLTVNVNQGHGNVAPFRTTPVTVQTTTTALVGEKVDMKIDFPVLEQPQVTTTAELTHSSSDEENRKHYVVKSVTPKKSSLKVSRDYDTSQDSTSDLIYTKKESITGDIIIGGKNRKTLFDNRTNTDHSSKTYVVSNPSQSDRGRSKTKVSGKIKHHSPERFFKNAQLSLKRDNSSDEDSKHYRTVTRVVLDSDNVDGAYSRSGSESPDNRYRVMTNRSSSYQDNSFSDDDQYYEVDSRRFETDTRGKRRRYKVINNSSNNFIDSGSVRAHSSPKPFQSHSKSFEQAHVTKLEQRTIPSHYSTLPSSSKRHKTVIQLDLDKNGIKEKGRFDDEFPEPAQRLYRTKSVDSLSNGLKVFQTNDDVASRRMWRTGRARSVGSSSDESSSDMEGSGPYNLTPTLVRSSKQKKGNKTYVVKNTVDDHQAHPAGWFKSTIDINEQHPERYDQNFIIQNSNSQSERMSQQRSDFTSSQAMEKSVYYVREATQPSYTQIPVQASPDSGRGTDMFSSDGENESMKKKFERVERIYEIRTEPDLPEQFLDDSVSTDMRVLRGKILIQNKMDDSSHFEDEFEENVNLFDNSFHLGKDNPLYASDSDLMAALRREEEQQEMSRHVTQDITYDQVDSMTQKYKTSAKAEIAHRPKRKQNLSTLLLSKLANVDSKDIRQTINVEHHNEEIVGDINFIHADGQKSGSQNTSNFDSVTENVELTLQQGKAYVIIKVIAERIIPTDLEFNIWRKSQAIVTRQIEIDLLANEQRRRFYHHVMDTQGRPYLEGGSSRSQMSKQERQLNSMETLKLFSQILDIADGQGDKDHTTMRTKQEMGQLPSSGADLLY